MRSCFYLKGGVKMKTESYLRWIVSLQTRFYGNDPHMRGVISVAKAELNRRARIRAMASVIGN